MVVAGLETVPTLIGAFRPRHGDRDRALRGSESELHAGIVRGEVAATSLHPRSSARPVGTLDLQVVMGLAQSNVSDAGMGAFILGLDDEVVQIAARQPESTGVVPLASRLRRCL